MTRNRLLLTCLLGLALALIGPNIRRTFLDFTMDEQHPLFINASPFCRDVPNGLQRTDNQRQYFRLMDLDHNGRLVIKHTLSGPQCPELMTLHDRFINLKHRFEQLRPDAPLPSLFRSMDTNHDHRVSAVEFVKATRWMRLSVITLMRMDRNHDHVVTAAEFRGAPLTEPFVLGTDNMGRDILSRLLIGLRTSVLLALIAGLSSFLIGLTYGMVAGVAGGWVDAIMMRFVDVVYGLPYILMVVILVALRGPGFLNLVLAVLIVQWLPVARTVRSLAASAREQDFVLSAKAMGASRPHILLKHILPQVLRPSVTLMVVLTPNVVRQEVLLSFLGLGITPPNPSLGNLIADALSGLEANPLALLWPSLVLVVLLLGLQVMDRSKTWQ